MSALLPPPDYETAWLWLNLLLWLGIVPGLMWVKAAMSMADAVREGEPIHTPWLLAAMILPGMLLGLMVVMALQAEPTGSGSGVAEWLLCVFVLVFSGMAAFVAGEKAWLS